MYTRADYKNFHVASYVWAYYLKDVTQERLERDIEEFVSWTPLKKVYLENHRGLVDVPKDKLRLAKAVFEKHGIEASGGLTSTALVNGEKKPSIFDSFCYTDEAHRAVYLGFIADLAEVFDEIILDDFYFTACRCEKCIAAKGEKSWSQYRLDLMEEFSREIVAKAKSINPKLNFIIKYPAWYKAYHETGYNPGKQRDIFDMIYTGTETRQPVYDMQHMQRYHSYAIMRFMENVAPGRNGGGWIDSWGSSDNINRFIEQADQTMFAGAKELMLFNFEHMLMPAINCMPSLAKELYRVDRIMGMAGKPMGVSVYEPFDSEGEELMYTYMGMGGVALEPTPEFKNDAPVVFVTASSAKDREIVKKLTAYAAAGGNVVMTTGFLRAAQELGVRELTSVQLTGRFVSGSEYMVANRNYEAGYVVKGTDEVMFEALQTRDNASWSDIAVLCREFNTPVMTEEDYGRGRVFVLNVPQNYADFYRLPQKVWETMSKHLSMGQRVYASGDTKFSFFAYDNNLYGAQNFAPYTATVRIIVRGAIRGLRDAETGEEITFVTPMPAPGKPGDAAACIPEEREYAVEVQIPAGSYRFFHVI